MAPSDKEKETISIRRADNGYIVERFEETEMDGEGRMVAQVFADKDTEEFHDVDSLRLALYAVAEALGYNGSRHDEKRLYLVIAPGDKSEKFTEAHSKVIFGGED